MNIIIIIMDIKNLKYVRHMKGKFIPDVNIIYKCFM